jgi:hypothetical protein
MARTIRLMHLFSNSTSCGLCKNGYAEAALNLSFLFPMISATMQSLPLPPLSQRNNSARNRWRHTERFAEISSSPFKHRLPPQPLEFFTTSQHTPVQPYGCRWWATPDWEAHPFCSFFISPLLTWSLVASPCFHGVAGFILFSFTHCAVSPSLHYSWGCKLPHHASLGRRINPVFFAVHSWFQDMKRNWFFCSGCVKSFAWRFRHWLRTWFWFSYPLKLAL